MTARMHDAWVGEGGCMPGVQVQLAGRRKSMIRPPIFAEADDNGKANVPLAAGKAAPGGVVLRLRNPQDAAFAA
jgi:hypothetical protein